MFNLVLFLHISDTVIRDSDQIRYLQLDKLKIEQFVNNGPPLLPDLTLAHANTQVSIKPDERFEEIVDFWVVIMFVEGEVGLDEIYMADFN